MNSEEKLFTLELKGQAVDIIMAGLGELSLKHALPVFETIRIQLAMQKEADKTPEQGGAPLQDKVIP